MRPSLKLSSNGVERALAVIWGYSMEYPGNHRSRWERWVETAARFHGFYLAADSEEAKAFFRYLAESAYAMGRHESAKWANGEDDARPS